MHKRNNENGKKKLLKAKLKILKILLKILSKERKKIIIAPTIYN